MLASSRSIVRRAIAVAVALVMCGALLDGPFSTHMLAMAASTTKPTVIGLPLPRQCPARLDRCIQVPPSQILGGVLPAGVKISGSAVTGDIDAGQVVGLLSRATIPGTRVCVSLSVYMSVHVPVRVFVPA